MVATGATNRMIAQQLTISPNTVKVHLRNTFTKLEISSRTEATVIAIREGWVHVPGGPPVAPAPADDRAPQPAAVDSAGDLAGAAIEPPLPLGKRIYLIVVALVVMIASAGTWPRVYSREPDSCTNEFTADCATDAGALEVGEPESLWVSGASMPQPRGRFAVAVYEDRLYLIGGETPDGVVGSVAIYDPQRDSWTSGADKPTPAANLSAVVLGSSIYAIGGGGAQGAPLNALEVYDPATDTWSEATSLPSPLAAHASVVLNGRAYVFGGWNGTSYTGHALSYDPDADRWDQLPLLPTPRGFAGAAVVQDTIMVIGGYDGQREYAVCEKLELVEQRWEVCPSMSAPRGGIGVAAVAGQIYVIGGGWESFVTFSERYNPRSDAWYNVETPLLLTGGEWRNLGVATVGTRVYALGGWQRGRYLNANQAYETLPNRLYLPATSGQ